MTTFDPDMTLSSLQQVVLLPRLLVVVVPWPNRHWSVPHPPQQLVFANHRYPYD
jgi:hypothetical protein